MNSQTPWVSAVWGSLGGCVAFAALWVFSAGTSPTAAGWSQVGVIATIAGILAALLGIGLAVVFAPSWVYLDKRTRQATAAAVQELEGRLDQRLVNLADALAGFSAGWSQPARTFERVVRASLEKYSSLHNALNVAVIRILREVESEASVPNSALKDSYTHWKYSTKRHSSHRKTPSELTISRQKSTPC